MRAGASLGGNGRAGEKTSQCGGKRNRKTFDVIGSAAGNFVEAGTMKMRRAAVRIERGAVIVALAAMMLGAGVGVYAQQNKLDEGTRKLSRDMFKQLIEINTSHSVGSTTTAAEAMAARLRNAGFPAEDVQVLVPESNPKKGNMVARLRAPAGAAHKKPILFICHLDVVEANRADWSVDPFTFLEKDGYFYGRGTEDIKDGDAFLVTNFIRLKKENYQPDRDLILALTADEEG